MEKLIELELIQNNTRRFYEACSDITVLQKELEQLLTEIEKNSIDFEKGKIPKGLFEYNENKLKREAAKVIKRINNLIDLGVSLINRINKEFTSQKIETKEKSKKKKVKKVGKKKKKPKKKVKKKVKTSKPKTATETKSSEAPSKQKIEKGS